MVETPAAAIMTPVLAKYVDFFSIGTNDLVQYTLAVDRGNANISYLYNHFNPAVLRLVQRTISSARENGIWAGMRRDGLGSERRCPAHGHGHQRGSR